MHQTEPVEPFLTLDEVTQPDERHSLIDLVTGSSLTLEALYRAIEAETLNIEVPDEIQGQFNITRNLAVYTWFSYSLDPVVQLKSYILIEHALNIRDGKRNRSLSLMLKRAVEEKWIVDAGFRHISVNKANPQAYCSKLIETLPHLRNRAAHGSNVLNQEAISSIKVAADFLNQLYPANADA